MNETNKTYAKFPGRSLLLLSLCMLSSPVTLAMDVSPYKPGQTLTHEQARELKGRYDSRKVQPWKPAPDIKSLEGRKDADLVRYGIQVLDKTVLTIGPKTKDASKRYSGNGLNCSSCHLKGTDGLPGTKKYAIPFINMNNDYPNFRARNMAVGTAADRVNGCMTRSMGDGRPFPADSRELRGILAYFTWLAQSTEKGLAMQGTGLPSIKLPARAARPAKGKQIYAEKCQSCHGVNGKGTPAPDYGTTANYLFPPLAGNDSFNNGAGMSRIIKATRFIHANMPLGASADKPLLTVDEAFDVAGYLESLPRPEKAGRDKDFPDPAFRPADYPVPAYYEGDKQALEKARFGPFN
jgi:cytochrome c